MEQRRRHGKSHPADGGGSGSSSSGSGGDSDGGGPESPSGSQQGPSSSGNAFANDGSFMEMFKKKMEAEMRKKAEGTDAEEGHKKPPPVTSFVGKRRGGVFLKTGMVAKKQKQDTEATPGKSDAWSKYMAEVKKYKAHQCGDDDKTRPLVK
ncbi:telomerase RNA component interacting RNase [Corythoichthys intestinalis]|uniref:telomerase RNA component interacting RNase n=1 Tax=Corythoichthys intestinalis TaxID=161448 RepID=UPI0025A666AB|nr:telomerase RNA component interacting RNase [Corythoichthys intestinalis]XP_061804954.1 telomerase RNA component interacting RNase-like [Nerophis lumbriciformis]